MRGQGSLQQKDHLKKQMESNKELGEKIRWGRGSTEAREHTQVQGFKVTQMSILERSPRGMTGGRAGGHAKDDRHQVTPRNVH